MSWRVSFYEAEKNNPVTIETDNDNNYSYVSEINGDCIAYDTATDLWCVLKDNEDFQKEITCLCENDDCDYYSITKKGFKMIILEARTRIIEYMKAVLELDENPNLKLTGDIRYWRKPTLREYIEEDLKEWEASYISDNGNTSFFNIKLDLPKGKFGISSSWKYKYAIFDLIEIYKYFDWNNYTMVVWGG